MEQSSKPENGKTMTRRRPFLLTALCLFSFIFFGIISLLILVSMLYSGSFRDLINTYVTSDPLSSMGFVFRLLLLFVLTAAAFMGTLLMWRMKRLGYYLFGIPVLAICCYQLLQQEVPTFTTAILILLLVLFGIFFRKFR